MSQRDLLVCEELFCLLTKEDGHRQAFGLNRGIGVVAGLVVDLHARGLVDTDGSSDRPTFILRGGAPTGDRLLDEAMRRLADKDGNRLSSILKDGKLAPQETVAARLVELGVLEHRAARFAKPAAWPTRDPNPRREALARLLRVVRGGAPTDGDACEIAVIRGLRVEGVVFRDAAESLGKRGLRDRCDEIGQGTAPARAIAAAVSELVTASTAAVVG